MFTWHKLLLKVKCDHRSKFSNLSNWKEEAWKKSGLQRDLLRRLQYDVNQNYNKILDLRFTAMITLHFHLLPQFKYELFHIYFTV